MSYEGREIRGSGHLMMEFKTIFLSPRDKEFFKIRAQLRDEIIALFGIPPSLIKEVRDESIKKAFGLAYGKEDSEIFCQHIHEGYTCPLIKEVE